ncbi:MAG: adenylyl-sulfate kinase [Bacilli bacterium]
MDNLRNLTWNDNKVTRAARAQQHGHTSCAVWFTGLSGAGKSTIANSLELQLHHAGIRTYLLDGDNVRHGLNQDLGFSMSDRQENIRRVAHTARLFVDAGIVVIVAMISPLRADRNTARALFAPGEFIEVFVECPLEVCIERDPKGLYKQAQAGAISDFTGISSPYEPPLDAEITIHTDWQSVEDATHRITHHVSGMVSMQDGAELGSMSAASHSS